jgi:hypothetical protein
MRIWTVTALLALAAAAAAVAPAARPASHTAVHATLTYSAGTVHGAHFARRELVRVTFLGPAPRRQRQVKTNARGRFTVQAPTVDPCVESLAVTAVGARGDSARLKLPQRACPMP